MKEFKYVITDPEGIHARPAGELVKAAKEFAANITLTKDGKSGDCKRIFGIMGLAVKAGNEITLNTGKTYIALVSTSRWSELVLK